MIVVATLAVICAKRPTDRLTNNNNNNNINNNDDDNDDVDERNEKELI